MGFLLFPSAAWWCYRGYLDFPRLHHFVPSLLVHSQELVCPSCFFCFFLSYASGYGVPLDVHCTSWVSFSSESVTVDFNFIVSRCLHSCLVLGNLSTLWDIGGIFTVFHGWSHGQFGLMFYHHHVSLWMVFVQKDDASNNTVVGSAVVKQPLSDVIHHTFIHCPLVVDFISPTWDLGNNGL